MTDWKWERDDFDHQGKLKLLYRHQRLIDEGWIRNRVLDIGGWGKIAFRLAQEGHEVILLNFWKPDLEESKMRAQNAFALICADAHHLPFQNQVFDSVHSSETLEHVKCAEKVCDEVFRVLRNKGIFCGTVPIPGICHKIGEPEIRFFNKDEIKTLLSKYVLLKIEETASITSAGEPCSIMFVGEKDNGS